jgi:hypothetical protein
VLGGFMIGYVQGLQTIVDAVNAIVYNTGINMPNAGISVTQLVQAYVQNQVNPSFGSYWELGVLFAFVGFVLVARGDRKPRTD